MKVSLLIFLPGIFCLALFRARAQNPSTDSGMMKTSVQSLTVENGLPQGYVNGIVQDSIGFIWLGTKDGLARYDGHKVKVFRNDPADITTLTPGIIQTIYSDRENQIWILYDNNEVDIFNPLSGKARHLAHTGKLGWLTRDRHNAPFTLYEDKHRRYWMVSSNLKTLFCFGLRHPEPVNIAVPKGEKIIALQEDRQGKIWVCTNLALYKIQNKRFHKIAGLPYHPDYMPNRISCMIQDKAGNWLIRNNGCIEIFKPGGQWQIIKMPPSANTALIYFMCRAKDGSIYLNSAGSIYRLNKDYTLSLIWTNPNSPGDFRSMLADRSNVLWIGMDTFGACLISLISTGFHSFAYRYGFVMDVFTKWFQIPFTEKYKQNVDSYYPRHAYDRQGRLWFTRLMSQPSISSPKKVSPPLFLMPKKEDKSIIFQFNIPGWFQIAFDAVNNCWGIVSNTDQSYCELVKANIFTGDVQPVMRLPHLFYEIGYLTSFCNKLCITYNDGIQLYDPQTGRSVFYSSKNKFSNATLLMATPGPQDSNILWISTMGNGLIKFNTITGKSKAFTEKDNVPSNTVYAAIPDKKGNLWCSSNKGIFRFNPATGSILCFTMKDGLQGNEFNRYHFLKTPDGHIIFGGTLGWTVFDPASIHTDNYQPPAVITEILINNIPLRQLPGWKDSAVSALHSLKLNYNQNFVTFTFAGLEFNDPSKLQYRYQLQGFNNQWINAKSQQTANYTGLAPGHYLFRVNASNTAGKWSPDVKTMQLIILPPWWKTWWAYTLYGIIILAAGYTFYRYRMDRLYTQNAIILKEKEAEQLREVDEMKTRFFSNITHEFRTPLSLIISPLEQINKEEIASSALKKKLSGIQRNAQQLLHLINQLLDMSKVEAGNMKVFLSRGDLGLFVADNINLFANQAANKNIQLDFNNAVHGEYLFDSDKWQKIIFNLLSNAIKFTSENGNIYIYLSINNNEINPIITLTVKDTGIGIKEDKLPFIFNRFYQADNSLTRVQGGTGIGLALTKELTEFMGGTIEAESPPEGVSQTEESGKGTIFRISIPVKEVRNDQAPLVQEITADPSLAEGEAKRQRDRAKERKNEGTMEQQGMGNELENPRKNINEVPLVLIAEDNKELNRFITETLEKNYRIMTAYDGKEALNLANENLPNVIISDIMMPEMDGYTFCKSIKQSVATNHIAFVMLSAKGSQESIIKGLESYADDYITKPFHPDELLLRIHNLCDRQQKLKAYYNRQLTHPKEKMDQLSVNDPFLKQLYQILEDDLDKVELNVESLSKKMIMSRRTLNRKLEMLTGLSANKMIRQYRLKKAAEMLRSGHNVSDAAYSTGFETPSYFSISFKSFYGVSPSEYGK